MPAKKIAFGRPDELHRGLDALELFLPFTVVDAALIGAPEEETETKHCAIIVSASRTLICCWKIDGEDLEKVMFEYGKRHIIQKIRDRSLQEKEELILTTANTPTTLYFDPNKIDTPNGATYTVELPSKPIMQEKVESELAEAIIGRGELERERWPAPYYRHG